MSSVIPAMAMNLLALNATEWYTRPFGSNIPTTPSVSRLLQSKRAHYSDASNYSHVNLRQFRINTPKFVNHKELSVDGVYIFSVCVCICTERTSKLLLSNEKCNCLWPHDAWSIPIIDCITMRHSCATENLYGSWKKPPLGVHCFTVARHSFRVVLKHTACSRSFS